MPNLFSATGVITRRFNVVIMKKAIRTAKKTHALISVAIIGVTKINSIIATKHFTAKVMMQAIIVLSRRCVGIRHSATFMTAVIGTATMTNGGIKAVRRNATSNFITASMFPIIKKAIMTAMTGIRSNMTQTSAEIQRHFRLRAAVVVVVAQTPEL